MNLFERLFKPRNPGSQPPIVIILFMILALTALGIPFYLAEFPQNWQQNWVQYLGILGGEIIYIVIGFFFRPQPDTSNIGWADGWIDNPFRISDNFNRIIALIKILLLPGRLIARAILNFTVLIATEQKS